MKIISSLARKESEAENVGQGLAALGARELHQLASLDRGCKGIGRVGLGHGYTAAGPHSLHVGMPVGRAGLGPFLRGLPVGRAGLGPFLRGLLLGLQRRQTSSRQNTRDRDL